MTRQLDLTSCSTIMDKIFETNYSFLAKERITGKIQFLFLRSFLLILAKFSFYEEDWALAIIP